MGALLNSKSTWPYDQIHGHKIYGCESNLVLHPTPVVPEIVLPGPGFSYIVNEFQPIAFVCQATGIPAPTINWYRNGILFDEASNNRVSIATPGVSPPEGPNDVFSVLRTLTFESTRDDDSDTYTCVADNGNRRMPNDTLDFELFVNGRSIHSVQWPIAQSI